MAIIFSEALEKKAINTVRASCCFDLDSKNITCFLAAITFTFIFLRQVEGEVCWPASACLNSCTNGVHRICLSFSILVFLYSSENDKKYCLVCACCPTSHTVLHLLGYYLKEILFLGLATRWIWALGVPHAKRCLLFHHTEHFTYGTRNTEHCRVQVFTPGAAATGREIKEEDRSCGYAVTASKRQESGPDLGKALCSRHCFYSM